MIPPFVSALARTCLVLGAFTMLTDLALIVLRTPADLVLFLGFLGCIGLCALVQRLRRGR